MASISKVFYSTLSIDEVKIELNLKGNFTRCPKDVIATGIYVLIVRQNCSPDGQTLLNIRCHRQDDDNNERWIFLTNSRSCAKRKFVIVYYLEVEVILYLIPPPP